MGIPSPQLITAQQCDVYTSHDTLQSSTCGLRDSTCGLHSSYCCVIVEDSAKTWTSRGLQLWRALESGGGWRIVAKHYELNIAMQCMLWRRLLRELTIAMQCMLWRRPSGSSHGSSATDGVCLSRNDTACISDRNDASHTSGHFNCQVRGPVACMRWWTCSAVSVTAPSFRTRG